MHQEQIPEGHVDVFPGLIVSPRVKQQTQKRTWFDCKAAFRVPLLPKSMNHTKTTEPGNISHL